MELLIVIFFFTIASSICVLVMSNAKEKSVVADDVKKTIVYGQNLIQTNNEVLKEKTFALDEVGNVVDQGCYQGEIKVKKQGTTGCIYTMTLQKNQKVLSEFEFFLEGDTK